MSGRQMLGLVVLVAAPIRFAGASLLLVTDDEPNDTIATATDTGLIDLGTAVVTGAAIGNGPLAGADRDFFAFQVTPEAELPLLLTVAMDATYETFDGYLRLFAASADEIINHDDASASEINPLLQTYIVEPGVYYVAVSHAMNPAFAPDDDQTGRPAGTGDYELSIVLSPALRPDGSMEPPDGQPVLVESVPALITGQFIGDGPDGRLDRDDYFVEIAPPAILIAEVRATHLGLLQPTILNLRTRNTPQSSTTIRLERAVFEGSGVGIVVTGHDPQDKGEFTGTGYYEILIDVIPVSSGGGPAEPNDSLLEATPTDLSGPGSVTLSAVIGDGAYGELRGDVDFFEVILGPNDRLTAAVSPTGGPGGLSPVLQFYDYLGSRIGQAVPDENGVASFSPRGDCRLEEDGAISPRTFYVAVMGTADRVTMDPMIPNPLSQGCEYECPPPAFYALDGGPGSTGGYQLDLTVEAIATCDTEPDDSIPDVGDPVVIDAGSFHCSGGGITDGPCGDPAEGVDLYRVRVISPPLTLDARLDNFQCGYRRMLRLFDADGQELAEARSTALSVSGITPVGPSAQIRYSFDVAGDYFIGVSDNTSSPYDPFVPCSGQGDDDNEPGRVDLYALDIELSPPPVHQPGGLEPGVDPGMGRLFATSLDFLSGMIVELDPATGDEVRSFTAPESPLGGREGIAFDGSSLFFLGNSDRYPLLYRLDAETGEVLDSVLAWFGSGSFGGMVAQAGVLYVLDVLDDAIYAMPATLHGSVTRLDVGGPSGVSMFGAMAATASQSRLIVSDAADPAIIHYVDPSGGAVIDATHLADDCTCNADFDGDGDVDDDDVAFFDACAGVAIGPCVAADLNCDGFIDGFQVPGDTFILNCLFNGPDEPPNKGCCPEDLPDRTIRATGLATTGPDFIVAGDWVLPGLDVFNRVGDRVSSVPLTTPAAALAGTSFAGGDGDGDFDVDLLDFRLFQVCFHPDPPLSDDDCAVFDFDFDDDVDLLDFEVLQAAFTGDLP